MKRKVLSALLAATMVGSLLAGCGNSSTSSSSKSSAGSSSAGTAESSAADDSVTKTDIGEYTEENPYHLVFSYIEFYQQDDAARTAVQNALNEYMIPKYHTEVEFLPLQASEYAQKVQLMISGGDELDVIPVFFTNASSWIAMNGIVDMNQYMDTPEGKAIIDTLGEANAYVGSMNGILFGFPAQKESVDIGGLCMRADICDELGFTEEYGLDQTQDEYDGTIHDWSVATEMFQKVKEAHPEMTPLYLQGSNGQVTRIGWCDMLGDGFGVLDWDKDHTSTEVVNMYETDTYKNAVKLVADWFDKGYIYQDALTDQQGGATMMKAGNTFSMMTSIKPGCLVEAKAACGTDCYVMYFGQHVEGALSTANTSYYDTGIASNSADPEMAFKFISALYTDPTVMNLWQNGIEGVNYQVLDDGTAYFVDGEDASNYKYHQNTGWMMGNQFNTYVWNDGSRDTGYWDELQAHNEWAEYSPAYGFMWDSSNYSTQITALQNALSTYRPALETGSVGVAGVEETLKKLNEALYAAGLQDVMDEKQKQLDEWLDANGGPAETPQVNLDKIEAAKEANK